MYVVSYSSSGIELVIGFGLSEGFAVTGLKAFGRGLQSKVVVLIAMLLAVFMVLAPQSVYATETGSAATGTPGSDTTTATETAEGNNAPAEEPAPAADSNGLTAGGGTKAYELIGEWKQQRNEVTSGLDVLSMVWWLDINDSAAAPGNRPTKDNLLTVTVENAHFGEIPSQCLSRDKGASKLSEDKRTLTCDIGERDEGTAQMVLSGVKVDGPGKSKVKATATFRGLEAELPEIPVIAPFLMDAKFDGGAATSLTGDPDTFQFMNFPFSLAHAKGSAKGPDTVSYDITINGVNDEDITLQDVACAPIDRVQPGYPFSASGKPENQTTKFPTCEFTAVEGKKNTFRLTLSDLDYTSKRAELDSNGVLLPQVQPKHPREVIAAGELRVKVPYVTSGPNKNEDTNIHLEASAPTYTAEDGSTAQDDPSNNENKAPLVRGNWTGAWVVASQWPKAYPGIGWSDTSRAPAGATVMSVSGIGPRRPGNSFNHSGGFADTWICNTLDTKRVDFVDARVVADPEAKPNVYYGEHIEDLKILYYTGEVEDPNLFKCGTKETPFDEGKDEKDGWSYTKPADLSTVKALKVRIPHDKAYLSKLPKSRFYLTVEQRIHDDAQPGDDVWTFTSVLEEDNTEWNMDLNAKRYFQRITDEEEITPSYASPGVVTDGVRYPYTGPGRDLLRVVGSLPVVAKDAAQPEYGPGEEADFTIRYGLESEIANMPNAQVVIKDTLPKGMEYVAGSADVEPEVSTNSKGEQVLTWTKENVEPNLRVLEDGNPGIINYKAVMPKDAKPGDVLTNEVTATSQGQTRKAQAKVTVPQAGYTSLKKNVVEPVIETAPNGVAANEWTIELTSKDPTKSNLTDVIDVLPANGDAQGSKFEGKFKVTGVEGAAGAKVYSTTVDPAKVDEDPNATINGATGKPSNIWTEGVKEDATAVRVITNAPLAYGDVQKITIKTELHNAKSGDVVVNKAVGRAENTKLRMRTSAQFTVRTPVDVTVEKVWKDDKGVDLTDTPKSVKVQLIRKQGEESTPVGDKVELNADNEWKHTFTNLPAVVDEEPVTYTVKEDEIEGFTSKVEVKNVDGDYQVTVTNTRKPELTPTPTPTPTPTSTPTPKPTPTPTPKPTPTPTPGTSGTPTPTPTPSGTPTPTPTPGTSETPTPGPTPGQPSGPKKDLASTGAAVTGLVALALAAIAGGALLMVRSRKQ